MAARDGRPFLAGSDEFGRLYGVKRLQVSQWISRDHTLDYTYARIVSGSPYWLLDFAKRFGETTPRKKNLNEDVLAELVEAQSPGYWESVVADLPPIVGIQECAAIFRISQQAMADHARGDHFPEGDYRLSGSPLWLLDAVAGPDVYVGPPRTRGRDWTPDAEVVAALREGRYDGPGAVIKPRGRAAKAAAGGAEE